MRENRKYGSEGGEVVIGLSYPYQDGWDGRCGALDSRPMAENDASFLKMHYGFEIGT